MELEDWEIDCRNIILEFREYLNEPLQETWDVMIPGAINSNEIPHSLLEDIKNAVTTEEYPPPYTIEVNQNYMNWGASNASQNLIFTIAVSAISGIIGNLVSDTLKTLFKNLIDERKDKTWSNPIESNEALERAKWHVLRKYDLGENEKELVVISSEENIKQSTWVYVFQFQDTFYECEIIDQFGYALCSRIKKSVN